MVSICIIKITKITTAEIRGTSSKFSRVSKVRIKSPSKIISEKQIKPDQKPVRTNDIATSIGVNVPIVGIPTTLRNNTTNKMPNGKIISHFNVFCSKVGKL